MDKEHFIQLADGSLFINDTDLQDEVLFVVKAVNSAGEAEETVWIELRPVPPESKDAINTILCYYYLW